MVLEATRGIKLGSLEDMRKVDEEVLPNVVRPRSMLTGI